MPDEIELMKKETEISDQEENEASLIVCYTPYHKIGEFETVGELKHLLDCFEEKTPIGFLNQPRQDLHYRMQNGEGFLAFQ